MTAAGSFRLYEHAQPALTVGQVREALAGLPDYMPISVAVPSQPGGPVDHELVVTAVDHATIEDEQGEHYIDPAVTIVCDYGSGEWTLS
jgi:hypothetical protein